MTTAIGVNFAAITADIDGLSLEAGDVVAWYVQLALEPNEKTGYESFMVVCRAKLTTGLIEPSNLAIYNYFGFQRMKSFGKPIMSYAAEDRVTDI